MSTRRAPREADIGKPDNPAQLKTNHQAGTDLSTRGGNKPREASVKVLVSHNVK
jgi:hypothetical protein